MSRGDAPRLAEWIGYHARIGFDDFHILLDAPTDDSEAVIRRAARDAGVLATVQVCEPVGTYLAQTDPAARWKAILQWRREHEEEIAGAGLPINDPISWRQYRHLPPVLEDYSRRGKGWVALIDVDEFLVLGTADHVSELVDSATTPRLRFLNFNLDTTGNDPAVPIREQHTMRWAREDIEAYGKGWENRVKSMVTYAACSPLTSVHPISRGPYETLPPGVARLHHYRIPLQGLPLPYPVEDRGALRF